MGRDRQVRTRNTVSKKAIVDILRANADKHLSYAEIERLLNEGGHTLGQATVYRVLRRLESDGVVNKYVLDGQPACYQYLKCEDCTTHCHAVCTGCGKLEHVDAGLFGALKDGVSIKSGFVMDVGRTVVYGLCRKCHALAVR